MTIESVGVELSMPRRVPQELSPRPCGFRRRPSGETYRTLGPSWIALAALALLPAAAPLRAQSSLTIAAYSLEEQLDSLPGGIAGHAYPVVHFGATGGVAPYTWSAKGLPAGMTLSVAALLSGTPRSAGVYNVTVTATDSSSPAALSASRDFKLAVSGNATLAATPQSALNVAVSTPFSLQLTAAGGAPPYTWSAPSGTLPAGLTLSAAGVLSGSPRSVGAYNFRAQVKDSAGATASLPLSLVAGVVQARSGVLPQIAAGGGWATTLYLINNSAVTETLSLNFFGDDGAPLPLGVSSTLPSGAGPSGPDLASVAVQLNPHSTLLVQTTSHAPLETDGWVDVYSSGPLVSFGVFDYLSWTETQSEGTVPLADATQTSYELPYDNMNGLVTAVALTNLSRTGTANVTAHVYGAAGTQLAVKTIALPVNGHVAFLLTDQVPASAGNRGIVQFTSDAGTPIAGLGLRATPNGGLTSIPPVPPE
jgi:hypothetical protein